MNQTQLFFAGNELNAFQIVFALGLLELVLASLSVAKLVVKHITFGIVIGQRLSQLAVHLDDSERHIVPELWVSFKRV